MPLLYRKVLKQGFVDSSKVPEKNLKETLPRGFRIQKKEVGKILKEMEQMGELSPENNGKKVWGLKK